MKKALLIIGIILIVACVLTLLLAAWSLYGYYHVLDGSAALYARLHRTAIVLFIAGLVLAAAGTLCLILRARQ